MKLMLVAQIFWFFSVAFAPALAQAGEAELSPRATSSSLLREFEKSERARAEAPLPSGENVSEVMNRVRQAEAAYYVFIYQNRRANLTWQLYSSMLIFAIVCIIVLSGLVLSALQFYISLKFPPEQVRDGSSPVRDAPVTTFEASLSGLKLGSPVLGVIILAMSMVFFYLYVVNIYPIKEIDGPPVAAVPSPEKGNKSPSG